MINDQPADATNKPAPSAAKDDRVLEIIPGCIICKTCEFHAPDIFILREKELTAEVINPHPSEDRLPDVYEAIRKCPEHVIKFRKKAKA